MADLGRAQGVVHHKPGTRLTTVKAVTVAAAIATLSNLVLAEAPIVIKADSSRAASPTVSTSLKSAPITMKFLRSTETGQYSMPVWVSNINSRDSLKAYAWVDTWMPDPVTLSRGLASALGFTRDSGKIKLNVGGKTVECDFTVSDFAKADIHLNAAFFRDILGARNIVFDLGNERITFNHPGITPKWSVPFSMVNGLMLINGKLRCGDKEFKGTMVFDTGDMNVINISPEILKKLHPGEVILPQGKTLEDVMGEIKKRRYGTVHLANPMSFQAGGITFSEGDDEFPVTVVRFVKIPEVKTGCPLIGSLGFGWSSLVFIDYTSNSLGVATSVTTLSAGPQQ